MAAARDVREEANHIDRIGRQEALSGFREDADTLISVLDHPDHDGDVPWDIEQWASGLGVLGSCGRRNASIIDPEEFADAAVAHLKVRGKKADRLRTELEQRIRDSGVETGGWDHPGLSSYCDYVMTKDD